MIPLRDNNPTRRTPVVTIIMMIACIGVWFGIQNGGIVRRWPNLLASVAVFKFERG